MTNHDGDINYSSFSSEELREAYGGINRTRYPVNYKNLLDAIADRGISVNGSPGNSPQRVASFGDRIRVAVVLAVFCTMWCVSFYGTVQFPDSPIEPCGVDKYCGKQGQSHTLSEYRSFRRWETTMFFLWPGGILVMFGVGLGLKRSA